MIMNRYLVDHVVIKGKFYGKAHFRTVLAEVVPKLGESLQDYY